MIVDRPQFGEDGVVDCADCPVHMTGLCIAWLRVNSDRCPSKTSYALCCDFARHTKLQPDTWAGYRARIRRVEARR